MRILHIGAEATGIDQLNSRYLPQERDLGKLLGHFAHGLEGCQLLRLGGIEQILKLAHDCPEFFIREFIKNRLALGRCKDSRVFAD